MATSASTDGENAISECMTVDASHSFLWVIPDVTDELSPNSSYSKCAKFELKSFQHTWEIKLLKSETFLELHLKLIEQTVPFFATLSVCLLSCDMNREYERNDTLFFASNEQFSVHKFLFVEELLQLKETLLHNGDLLLFGTLTIMFRNDIVCDAISVPSFAGYYRRNMRSLLKGSSYADFTIKVDKREFHCHKLVLASRSPYFDSLFRCDVKETKGDILVLEDIEPDVFEQVLMFIYSNELEITQSTVVPLLEAAEKYQLQDLKDMCEEKMHQYLSFDNLSRIGAIADLFQLRSLKLRSLNMYAIFRKRLQTSAEFSILTKARSSTSDNEHSASCNNMKISTLDFKGFECALRPVQQKNVIPFANTWISNIRNTVFDCKIRLAQISSGSRSPTLLLRNENYKISFKVQHCFYWSSTCYHLYLYFTLLPSKIDKQLFHFQFYIVETSGKEVSKSKISQQYVAGCEQNILNLSFRPEDIQVYLHGKDLIMRCKIWIEDCSVYQCSGVGRENIDMDFTAIYENMTFADMIIRVNNTEFPCHRAIVVCQSPVLAALLEKNSNNDVIDLVDIEPDNLQKLLTLIYKEDYKLSEIEALKLLPFSCKFKLEHLKSVCERCLAQSLSFENAVEMLNLSVSCSAMNLQKCSLQFVQKFLKRFLTNPESSSKLQEYSLCSIILSDGENSFSE